MILEEGGSIVYLVLRGITVTALLATAAAWSSEGTPTIKAKPAEVAKGNAPHKPLHVSVAGQSSEPQLPTAQNPKKSFAEETGIGLSDRSPRLNTKYCALCEGPLSECDHQLVTIMKGGAE